MGSQKYVLVTGSKGFIGRNLVVHLNELYDTKVLEFYRGMSKEDLEEKLKISDIVFHLAGVNRPKNKKEFLVDNLNLTEQICQILKKTRNKTKIIFTSSIQAETNNPYGISKLKAEKVLKHLSKTNGNQISFYRLPNIFGKWSKPNYNSVVGTFCYNVINNIPLNIFEPDRVLDLVYIDDLVKDWIDKIQNPNEKPVFFSYETINKRFNVSVAELAETIKSFNQKRYSLFVDEVGSNFTRALYATYLSYLNPTNFNYSIPSFADKRGTFAEILKTRASGQFSVFTAYPGVTRGNHYHHTKSEKFLIVRGEAQFSFHSLHSGEFHSINASENKFEIVETVPGWAHNIKNIGTSLLVVLIWANENFDKNAPDTFDFNVEKKNAKF